jgi:hypothetical protein
MSNISVISWRSVLLVEETGIPRENRRPVASQWQILSHNVVSSTPRHERDSNSQNRWWYLLIAQVIVNLTTVRTRPRQRRLLPQYIVDTTLYHVYVYQCITVFIVDTTLYHVYVYQCITVFVVDTTLYHVYVYQCITVFVVDTTLYHVYVYQCITVFIVDTTLYHVCVYQCITVFIVYTTLYHVYVYQCITVFVVK